jgi:AraC-like DNA-binding protein
MWRADPADRVLLMAGRTDHYAIEPRGEYVFGVVIRNPMLAVRGLQRRLVQPGQLVAWDPSHRHAGTGLHGRPWTCRLVVVEAADLASIGGDTELDALTDVAFPEPVLSQPDLAREFLAMHAAFATPTTRLERDHLLAEWLRRLIERSGLVRPSRAPLSVRDDRALRLASDYLAEHLAANVGLDELASAAGIGKFRLIRLFRERTGLPPHALHVAHRIRRARLLLENGTPAAAVAAATGFADQSHLHRHFRNGLGVSPGEYQRRFRGLARVPVRHGTPST